MIIRGSGSLCLLLLTARFTVRYEVCLLIRYSRWFNVSAWLINADLRTNYLLVERAADGLNVVTGPVALKGGKQSF